MDPNGILSGKTALVTGGTSGIGLAITRGLARAGARVMILSHSEGELATVRGELAEMPEPFFFLADIRDRKALERVRDTLVAGGIRLDILVANAGTNVRRPALEMTDEEIRSIFDTNLYGSYITLQVLAPLLLDRPGGRVIVNSSVIAIHGMQRRAPYGATKAALSGLVRSLAVEWGPYGATVNAVGPGIIRTPLTAAYLEANPERAQAAIRNTPLGRVGEPEDVAGVVTFLASDAARFITGQTIFVDGGVSAGNDWW